MASSDQAIPAPPVLARAVAVKRFAVVREELEKMMRPLAEKKRTLSL
jgi:hypothetical protein